MQQMLDTEEEAGDAARRDKPIERANFCLPDLERDEVAHKGDDGFPDLIKQYFKTPESDALERLVILKTKLREANTHDFWTILLREMCDIGDAQCGIVAKRILFGENTAVEMPPLGEPGSCLMGVGLYLNGGGVEHKMHHDYQYQAHGSPCAHMKHDKVFIIPEKLGQLVRNSPNPQPWGKSEAFIGIPLLVDGKSFAHFSMIWSAEGAARRKLSWAFLEMFMHSLEDMILQRLLEGRGFSREPNTKVQTPARIIPIDAIAASQTLKPYARSLSHELRTPMQGVVGMLDMMYSTVIDAIECQKNEIVKSVFEGLKANIELVQDSSKRAVEAADNVVHAYDLNMQMPETSLTNDDHAAHVDANMSGAQPDFLEPDIVIEGFGIALSASSDKRPRDDPDFHPGPPMKRLPVITEEGLRKVYDCDDATTLSVDADGISRRDFGYVDRSYFSQSPTSALVQSPTFGLASPELMISTLAMSPPPLFATNLATDHRHISPRDFIRNLIDQAIDGIHPVEKVHVPNACGETIHVKTKGPRDEINELRFNIIVGPEVPERIITIESHLTFIVKKVVDNAIKFTPSGSITVAIKLSRSGQLLETLVLDTGCGISEVSREHIFRAHYQEDSTTSRAREGLGLSLFNAKALVRKYLNGDMTLHRSAVDGPHRGSELLIRVPLISSPAAGKFGSMFAGPPAGASPTAPALESPPLCVRNGDAACIDAPRIDLRPPPAEPHLLAPAPRRKSRASFDRHLGSKIPLTFLIAEDNAVNRNILVGFLLKLGYPASSISLAFDGAEAVQMYEMSLCADAWPGPAINTVLMDLWMPNMDGYEATERILGRACEGGGGGVPVVFAVTADITTGSRVRARKAGMKGFVSKPFRVLDIQQLIVEHFGEKGGGGG